MDTEESFEISFKPLQSSPKIPQSPHDSREVQSPHSLSASNSVLHVPVRDNTVDVILLMLRDIKMKFEQDMHEMRVQFQHVEKQNEIFQKDNAELRKLYSDRGDNHHSPIATLSRPNPHTYNVNESNCPSNGLYGSIQCPSAVSMHDCPINEFSHNNGNMPPCYPTPKSNVPVKLKGFDGSEDFNDFLAHFEIFVTLHGWDYRTKSLFLASSLASSAQALLKELNETQRMDYKSLVDI